MQEFEDVCPRKKSGGAYGDRPGKERPPKLAVGTRRGL